MSTLQWIANDLESMIPSFQFNQKKRDVPKVGEQAPTSPLLLPDGKNAVLLFTRHVGCPFCEKEMKGLIALAREQKDSPTQFIIITHSVPTAQLEDFVYKELQQDVPDNVTIHGDPERRVYIAFGLGELGWGDVINFGIIEKVKALQKEGISNRLTRGTRWQTNGGFAIDRSGIVKYSHVGKDSSDMMDLQAAFQSVA